MSLSLYSGCLCLMVSWDAYKPVQAWRAVGHSYGKPTLSLSYQDKKPVISLIHSVSLEILQSRLTSVLYTPYIRKMKRPCKIKWREKAVNSNHFSSRNTWNKLSWEQTKEDTLHQGQFIFLFFNIISCTLSIYLITWECINYIVIFNCLKMKNLAPKDL